MVENPYESPEEVREGFHFKQPFKKRLVYRVGIASSALFALASIIAILLLIIL